MTGVTPIWVASGAKSKRRIWTAWPVTDGISLASIFGGETIAGHETLFFAHSKGLALRHGDWKLVAIKQNNKPIEWELYNLTQDPIEQQNLAADHPAKVKELASTWEAESRRLAQQQAGLD